ncbi:bifunctional metallophosphatase/5'-nucleotidase, partial [Desulfovibrio sp. OttesenSCG-928-M16]|nr:bifunctional metallophosphatase/5'-nucleotidase [Desulfovibrio sp. OttesenSCG-928-M16]
MRHDRIRQPVLALLTLVCLALCLHAPTPALAVGPFFDLRILHSNDTHSIYGGYTATGGICYAPYCEGGKGGFVRLHQAISALRRDTPDALLLDAGDLFQGSLYWTLHKAAMPNALLRYFDYLAIAPGNHEFDEGCQPFFDLFSDLQTVPLAANLSFPASAERAGNMTPWLVTKVRNRQIGIIGLANPDTVILSSPCAEARFANAAAALRRAIAELESKGVDIIIALTHLGLAADMALAASIDGLDVIVGGHSHSLLSSSLPEADGAYPLVVRSPYGRRVLVVTAGSHGRLLGRLDLSFDAAGELVSWNGDVVALDDNSLQALDAPAPDPDLAALLESFSVPVRKVLHKPLGMIIVPGLEQGPLEGEIRICRQRECLSGNIVADALRTGFADAPIVLLNGGALRNSLPAGQVTAGNVLEALPYNNYCMATRISGQMLLQMLEHGLS